MTYRWWVEDGEVWASVPGGSAWHGTVEGRQVVAAIAIPGTDDGVVVLDWSDRPDGVAKWHPFANLLRIRVGGERVWDAQPPSADTLKSWTSVAVVEGEIVAHSWEFECEVDPSTGAIRSKRWTK